MRKVLAAFGLGLLSFLLFMFVGETAGLAAAFISMAVYFFACQYLLSRGNAGAYRQDWPVMLALDATVFLLVFIMERDVIMSQGLGVLLSASGGTYAGAVVASLAARRRLARP